jgi:hypothetical protein
LNVRHISSSGRRPRLFKRRKIGGGVHRLRSMTATHPGGRMRGMFSVMPPPVMWAMPLIGKSFSSARTVLA